MDIERHANEGNNINIEKDLGLKSLTAEEQKKLQELEEK